LQRSKIIALALEKLAFDTTPRIDTLRTMNGTSQVNVRELMRWYIEAGVDETISDIAVDRFQIAPPQPVLTKTTEAPPPVQSETPPSTAPARAPDALPIGAEKAIQDARSLAANANSIAALTEAIAAFEGCPLKKTAQNMCFVDGNIDAKILLIGEGPGAEEDRQGKPFVGASGQLLDRMLASIDLDRSKVLISNTVFWRPPGNRTPTTSETAMCLPFVTRLIELMEPIVIIALGGASAKVLLNQTQGIGRLRGKWFEYGSDTREQSIAAPIAAMAMFHPAYLLRSPVQKREAWRDLIMLKHKLAEL
jgi:uracil-DNA glycosylase